MPRVSITTGRALEWLDGVPYPLRRTDLFLALAAAIGEQLDDLDLELARLEALMTIVGAQDQDLALWEALIGVSPAAGATPAQRRTVLLAFYGRLILTGSGADWEAQASQLLGALGAAWTYTHTPATRTVAVLLASSGLTTSYAGTLLRSITPANTVLTVGTTGGMQWDGTNWDGDVWH